MVCVPARARCSAVVQDRCGSKQRSAQPQICGPTGQRGCDWIPGFATRRTGASPPGLHRPVSSVVPADAAPVLKEAGRTWSDTIPFTTCKLKDNRVLFGDRVSIVAAKSKLIPLDPRLVCQKPIPNVCDKVVREDNCFLVRTMRVMLPHEAGTRKDDSWADAT